MGNKVGCAGMGGDWALAWEWALGGGHRVVGSRRMGCGVGFWGCKDPLLVHLVWMAPGGGEVEVGTGRHSEGLAQDCWSHRPGVVGDNRKGLVRGPHVDRVPVGLSCGVTL